MTKRHKEGLIGLEYSKLFSILHERKMPRTRLMNAGVDRNVIAKLGRDEYVAIQSLEKIARYLECDIGDIVSIRGEDYESPNKHEAIVKEIALEDLESLLFGSDG